MNGQVCFAKHLLQRSGSGELAANAVGYLPAHIIDEKHQLLSRLLGKEVERDRGITGGHIVESCWLLRSEAI